MKFEPFQDRLSRDIRNDLSRAFAEGLVRKSLEPVKTVAEGYLKQGIAACYEEYIHDRLHRYSLALEKTRETAAPVDTFTTALILWNLQLFFEVHEILESAWRSVEGDEKMILQALIRAAGVYIKLEHGYREPAQKMAVKALPVLLKHTKFLSRYFDPAVLLESLEDLNQPPPILSAG